MSICRYGLANTFEDATHQGWKLVKLSTERFIQASLLLPLFNYARHIPRKSNIDNVDRVLDVILFPVALGSHHRSIACQNLIPKLLLV